MDPTVCRSAGTSRLRRCLSAQLRLRSPPSPPPQPRLHRLPMEMTNDGHVSHNKDMCTEGGQHPKRSAGKYSSRRQTGAAAAAGARRGEARGGMCSGRVSGWSASALGAAREQAKALALALGRMRLCGSQRRLQELLVVLVLP